MSAGRILRFQFCNPVQELLQHLTTCVRNNFPAPGFYSLQQLKSLPSVSKIPREIYIFTKILFWIVFPLFIVPQEREKEVKRNLAKPSGDLEVEKHTSRNKTSYKQLWKSSRDNSNAFMYNFLPRLLKMIQENNRIYRSSSFFHFAMVPLLLYSKEVSAS